MAGEREEQEFFVKLFETGAFKLLNGADFDIEPFAEHAKPLALVVFKLILHPDFNKWIRQKVLDDAGELCCETFLNYAGLSTDTDIDTFIANLVDAFPGERKLVRTGNIIHDEFRGGADDGGCRCPVMLSGDVEPTPLLCLCCLRSEKVMFEAVLGHSVQVEMADSVLRTDSDTCRWLIHLEPQIYAR